jgi:hypothetical protein
MSREIYPPIGALAAVGDGRSIALVGPDAGIEFFCPLRLDNPAVIFPLLDRRRGGWLRLGVIDEASRAASCQRRYRQNSAVLEAAWVASSGRARLQLAMAWPPPDDGQELLWLLECVEGTVEVEAVLDARPDFGRRRTHLSVDHLRASVTTADLSLLSVTSGIPLNRSRTEISGHTVMRAGDRVAARLHISARSPMGRSADPDEVAAAITATDRAWREWASILRYDGPRPDAVTRAAITLKQLIYEPTGAVVAATTTSLPEHIGGRRNWDYRFTWLRDASFTLNALYQLQCRQEAARYARWLCDATAAHGLPLRVLYGIDGRVDLTEHTLDEFDGYRNSRPVRIGNAAETQLQLDSYGELLDCLTICETMGDDTMRRQWPHFARLVDFAADHWREPDHGIWEVRSRPRHFVHSKALAWTALDRGCRLIESLDLPGDYQRWQAEADQLKHEVLHKGVHNGHFIRAYDDPTMDAALLMLPILGFIDGTDPRMTTTIDAVVDQLTPPEARMPGLLRRYLPTTEPQSDGLTGTEGAFTLCSFWLVEALALAGDLGAFAEQIDPATEDQLSNTPQAFTHIGLINAALRIAGTTAKGTRRPRGQRRQAQPSTDAPRRRRKR